MHMTSTMAFSLESRSRLKVGYPSSPLRRKKVWLSESTVEHLRWKGTCRRTIAHDTSDISRQIRLAAMHAWWHLRRRSTEKFSDSTADAMSMAVKLLHFNIAYIISILDKVQACTPGLVKVDREAHPITLAQQANEAAKKHDLRTLARCQRELVPKKAKNLPALREKDGEFIKTPFGNEAAVERTFLGHPLR